MNRAVDELTKKGYKPANSAPDKSLVGDVARDLAERALRDLLRKDYVPQTSGNEKFGLGDLVDIIVREVTKQGYVPNSGGPEKFFPGAEIIGPLVVDRVVRHFTG